MATGPLSSRSRDVNFATVSGNVTDDPSMRMTKQGQVLCFIRIANEVTVGSQTYLSYYNVHAFGSLGQRAFESLKQGDRVVMFGRWHERAYKDEKLGGAWRRFQNFVADDIAVSVMSRMSEWRLGQRDVPSPAVVEKPVFDGHDENDPY